MAGINIETLLSYHCLTGPLLKNPLSEYDKAINKLQVKYRTYIVEYDFDTGAVCLPRMFGSDFGDRIGLANVFIVAPESLSTLIEGTPSIRKDAQRYNYDEYVGVLICGFYFYYYYYYFFLRN
ncbi:transmembrane protein, putative [Medicago truncatula]|uniref:Transmembrane protein, putative n=1 Tax=Medicago truncatula TaxID=3880 RepID=G8A2N4_MEDTR|nr:transmembrane protein, putative [Medicago truncatula]